MRRIFAFGETILDIIFRNKVPIGAKPGGAMLNTAVSLGKCGLPVYLVSEITDDIVGKWILEFLEANRVNTDYLHIYREGATPVAIATLDDSGEARYSFYKPYPKHRLNKRLPELTSDDILLFGSFYSITPAIRPVVANFIRSANEQGAIVIYDPNIRANHARQIKHLRGFVDENLGVANIVRASNVDLINIFGTEQEEIWVDRIINRNKLLILTRAQKKVTLFSQDARIEMTPDKIIPLSTIGAGDSFNAGIIFGLFKKAIYRNNIDILPGEIKHQLLEYGNSFAQNCCLSLDNHIDEDFALGLE